MLFDFNSDTNLLHEGTTILDVEATENGLPQDEHSLLEQHLPLVRSVLGRIRRRVPVRLDEDELHSIGVEALIAAVRRFDPAKGRTFAAYATVRIRGAMLDELRRLDSRSRRARARARKLTATVNEIEQNTGRPARDEEVRRSLGLSCEEHAKWVEEARPVRLLAIDRPIQNDEGSEFSLHDLLPDDSDETGPERIETSELAALLTSRLEELPTQQKQILSMYYFEEMRVGEIARAFGVTPSRISQIHTQTLAELREWLSRARNR